MPAALIGNKAAGIAELQTWHDKPVNSSIQRIRHSCCPDQILLNTIKMRQ